jgi:hypothetical protein
MLGLGALAFLVAVTGHASLGSWLVLRYARCWALALLFVLACLAVGHALVSRLAAREELAEHVTLSFAAGLFAFATLIFLGGVAQRLSGSFFFLLPALLLVAAGPRAYRELWPDLRAALLKAWREPPSGLSRVMTAFGLLGILLVYLPILAPENVSYDARWYHLANAEHYASQGGIRAFPEGLIAGTYPQLATLLYTWAFLSPLGGLFDRVELAAHLELVTFLFTLAGIPVLLRRLLPSSNVRGAWAAFFLFPAIFVYDSELSCGADHVAALFAVPIFVALLRAWQGPAPANCALLGVCVTAAFSVKYTAASLVLGPSVALLARVVFVTVRRREPRLSVRTAWLGLATFAVVCLALTAPHWLKNWVFYGDPLYPLLADYFHPHPWTADSFVWRGLFRSTQMSIPDTVQVKSLRDLFYVLATFSVDVHDFKHFHGAVPVFGSLFSVATLALPFLKGTRSLLGLSVATYVGLAGWALLNAQDRYLQVLLPWMVVVTAGVLHLAWQAGMAARVASTLAVGLQVLWGADAGFLPSHAITHRAPAAATMDLIGGRYADTNPERLTPFMPWPRIGSSAGKDARVLLHEGDVHLGIGVPTVLDTVPFMFGVDYGRARSAADVEHLLRSLGVTHLVWGPTSHGTDSLAGDLVFRAFASQFALPQAKFGPMTLARMPTKTPPATQFGSAVVLKCSRSPYEPGVYELAQLAVPPLSVDGPARYPAPRSRWRELSQAQQLEALSRAQFLVTEANCPFSAALRVPDEFRWIGQRGNLALLAANAH